VGKSQSSRPTSRPTTEPLSQLRPTTPPPSDVTSLDDAFVIPERTFFDRLEERARRAELLAALLQGKGMMPERGARALQAMLGAVAASAEEAHLPSLASLGRALQMAIGELGVTKPGPTRTLDVLVLDGSEVSRDLVALAVESQGHIVRCAGGYEDFVAQLDERLPDLIVTEVEFPRVPARHFCINLVELLARRPVPLVFFSGVRSEELELLARRSRARAAIPKDRGLAALMPELERVLASV
jgi:CheY-like chemotaxis protein